MMQPKLSHRRINLGRSLAMAAVIFVMGGAASSGCGNSGLVGGTCNQGLTNCSNICVNLDIDQYNCGHCNHACLSGVACISGKCGGSDEVGGNGYGGSAGDGGHYRGGAAGTDATPADAQGDRITEFDVAYPTGGNTSTGGATNGGDSSGGAAGADAGEVDACTPPYNDALHCGDCTTVCAGATPVCAPSAGTYECRPVCDAPLVPCNGACVNLNSDPTNCGSCSNVCPSGACQKSLTGVGTCVGAQTGDFIAICMNYRSAPGLQTTLLLGNSIFLPRVAKVRILAYDQYADASASLQVDATIAAAATLLGRQYSIVRVNDSTLVPTLLTKSSYDVFLVYEQPNAASGELTKVGSIWSQSLVSFSYVGGVIVLLDGGQGVREMTALINGTTLFLADGEVGLSSTTILEKPVRNDAVVSGMTSQLACQNDTCVFQTSIMPDANTTFVITEPTNDAGVARPVAVHVTRTAPN